MTAMDQNRKRALLQEFNTVIAPQKLLLAQQLPQLWKQCYEPPPSLQGGDKQAATLLAAAPSAALAHTSQHVGLASASKGGAVKRPSAAPASAPDAKRVKPEATRKVEDLFKACMTIITKKLWPRKESNPFQKPVDVVALKIPDYYTFVKNPMDLGTIKDNLSKKKYQSPLEFREHVRLVWNNCAKYNPVGHIVRQYGDTLSDIFEKAWMESKIEEQWNQIILQQDPQVCLHILTIILEVCTLV